MWEETRPKLKLLVIDTCGPEGSIALADTDSPAAALEPVMLGGRVSSERLIPVLRGAMSERGWEIGDLAAIGVVSGPGSFTGVRVGVAAAKGLCEAGALPLVMVSRLAVLAEKAGSPRETVHGLLDAGRGEFFYGRFGVGEHPIEALLSREAVLAAVAAGGSVAVCEEGVRAAFAEFALVWTAAPSAADAVGQVSARVERGAFDDVGSSDANYLRRTDLEVLARLAQKAQKH